MLDEVCSAINKHAQENPNKLALLDAEAEITYRHLMDKILQKSKGINGSDLFMSIKLSNDIESVVDYLAARLAGRVPQIYHPSVSFASKRNTDEHQRIVTRLMAERNMAGADAMMSSGSTGEPKQVLVDFEAQNITTNFLNKKALLTKQDIELLILPISYSAGLGRLRASLTRGSTCLLVNSPIKFKKLIQMCSVLPPTSIGLTPATFRYINRSLGGKVQLVFKSINSVEFGSASLNQEEILLVNQIFSESHTKLFHYGLTEASRSSFLDLKSNNQFEPIGIGEIAPHASVSLERTNDGRFEEIVIEGRHTAFAVIEGENLSLISKVHTGDIGEISNGQIALSGRLAQVISVGGKDMFPGVLENFCGAIFPNVDFAVVGINDPLLGQVPVMITSGGNGLESSLLSEISEKFETHWLPRSILEIESFPLLPSGKIDKVSLQNWCTQNVR